MRSLFNKMLICAGIALISPSLAHAEEPVDAHPAKVVALDQPSATLLRTHFPTVSVRVIVLRENEPFSAVNQRALASRDADYVLYRSDRVTPASRLFMERLANRGARPFDLARRLSTARPSLRRSGEAELRELLWGNAEIRVSDALEIRMLGELDEASYTFQFASSIHH